MLVRLPKYFWRQLMSQIVSDGLLHLFSSVVLHVGVSQSFRPVLSAETSIDLLSWVLKFPEINKLSFTGLSTFLSVIINRKSFKSHCYHRISKVSEFHFPEYAEPNFKSLVQFSLLKSCPISSQEVPHKQFLTIKSPNDSGLKLLSKFFEMVSLLESSDVFTMVVHFFNHAYPSHMMTLRNFTGLYLRALTYMQTAVINPSTLIQEALCYMDWKQMFDIGVELPELNNEMFKVVEIFGQSQEQQITSVVCEDDALLNEQSLHIQMFSYFATIVSMKSSIERIDMFLKNLIGVMTPLEKHVNTLCIVLESIKRIGTVDISSVIPQMLMFIRQSFKYFKKSLPVSLKLISISTDLIKIISYLGIKQETRDQYIRFFHDLNGVVNKIVVKNFQESEELQFKLTEQMTSLFCYYWKNPAVDGSHQHQCSDICANVFVVARDKRTFRNRLVGNVFVVNTVTYCIDYNLHVVDLFRFLVTTFPSQTLDLGMSSPTDQTVKYLLSGDVRQARVASFLQTWLPASSLIKDNIFEIGQLLLPFLNSIIPNIDTKPQSFVKFLSLFHQTDKENKVPIWKFVEKVMSKFITEWEILSRSSNEECQLSGNVTHERLVLANIDEVIWTLGICRTGQERQLKMVSYFRNDKFDQAELLRPHLVTMIARIVILESISDDKQTYKSAHEYICSLFSSNDLWSCINKNICLLYWDMLSFLLTFSGHLQGFEVAVALLHSKYLGVSITFDKWLSCNPGKLLQLIMLVVSKWTEEDKDNFAKIWCGLLLSIVSCTEFWSDSCRFSTKDGVISVIIVRHLNILRMNVDGNTGELISVLKLLVQLSIRITSNANLDVCLYWFQQLFYVISEFWTNLTSQSSLLNEIFSLFLNSPKWDGNKSFLDRFIFDIPGFSEMSSISCFNNSVSAVDSIKNTLTSFDKFGVSILQYRTKSLCLLSSYLSDLLNTDILDPKTGNILQRLNDVLHFLLEFSKIHSPITMTTETVNSIISCLMYLKLLLPQVTVTNECQLASVGVGNGDPSVSGRISLVSHLMYHALYSSGKDSWACFLSLSHIGKSVDLSTNQFLAHLTGTFSEFINTDIYHLPIEFDSILSHLVSPNHNSVVEWGSELARMLSSRSSEVIYNHCHPDVFSLSSIVYDSLPKLFATLDLSDEETISLANTINTALHSDDYHERNVILVHCILVRSQYLAKESPQITSERIDLFCAAKIAYHAKMYTATLFILEQLWLVGNRDLMDEETVDLYEKCFKSLSSQEELTANNFILRPVESDSNCHLSWLLRHGQFDILRQLTRLDPNDNLLSTSSKYVGNLDILWKLSRWNDEEQFEINSIIPDNAATLTMYDFLYTRSVNVEESYRQCVADLCRTSWDQEVCIQPLLECATLNSSASSMSSVLESLIRVANKSNICQLDSSISWSLVCSGKSTNGVENISRHSLAIADVAISCQRPEYVDLIQDMFNLHHIDKRVMKCSGETAFVGMIEVIKNWGLGQMKKSYAQLEQLVLDCQTHFTTCLNGIGEHELLKELYCKAVSKFCLWNQDYSVHSAPYIKTKILDPAIRIFENVPMTNCHLLDTLATFSYQQYCHISQYMQSSEYDNRQKILIESKRDIGYLDDLGDKSRLRRILERQSLYDGDDLSSLDQDKNRFLLSAVISCSECLQMGDEHNLKVFRLISMWLNNDKNGKLNALMAEIITKVASYKFLVLMPQLCARLNSDNNKAFETNLEKLIQKIILDHPYHSIYNLLAIRNANKDEEYATVVTLKRKRPYKDDSDTDKRIGVAYKIVEKLLKSSRAAIVRDADLLTSAYIQWANTDVTRYRSDPQKKIKMPQSCQLVTIGKHINLPVPTLSLPIDTSLKYPQNQLVSIVAFENVFSLQGGVNLPKVVWCQSSDGITRRQLVKSKDDLRQDSVMQQVFAVVNSLFRNGDASISDTRSTMPMDSCDSISNGMVKIRTYKVIPTTQTSGLIEWCEGTVPLGDWLGNDKSGAHLRYRPKDLTPNQCKIRLHLVREKGLNERIETFKNVYNKIKPVLGHFLLENFPDPRRWFKARKSYIHSVAINSITGFILGLGDRHVQNILLDLNTAELIHIDLGIAFDQGRLLPTPELVPFRLTRDLVHAMGPFGVEGRFKTTCCSVLNMLRGQKDIILTLIEVLLHDPLHTWTVAPHQARLLQAKRMAGMDCSNVVPSSNISTKTYFTTDQEPRLNVTNDQNQMAERVILEMSRKLAGAVDNSYLNTEGHVNYLIQSATDIDNLCRMYYGWQAYL